MGDVRGFVVADDRHQRCAKHEALLNLVLDHLSICFDALDAVERELFGDIAKEPNAVEYAVGHHWHGDIEFHQRTSPAQSANPHGDIIACNSHGHLHDGFDEHWIDLARHD